MCAKCKHGIVLVRKVCSCLQGVCVVHGYAKQNCACARECKVCKYRYVQSVSVRCDHGCVQGVNACG